MNRLRKASLIILSLVFIMCISGCNDSNSKFIGSKTGNDNQFLVDFEVLNSTVDSDMPLSVGETIETTIDVIKGDVDILIENENGTIAYKGTSVKSGSFTIDIDETGEYTFFVTGHKAKGNVYFIKSISESSN